jgi:hypothetical protein
VSRLSGRYWKVRFPEASGTTMVPFHTCAGRGRVGCQKSDKIKFTPSGRIVVKDTFSREQPAQAGAARGEGTDEDPLRLNSIRPDPIWLGRAGLAPSVANYAARFSRTSPYCAFVGVSLWAGR